jgi:hypothetical protein
VLACTECGLRGEKLSQMPAGDFSTENETLFLSLLRAIGRALGFESSCFRTQSDGARCHSRAWAHTQLHGVLACTECGLRGEKLSQMPAGDFLSPFQKQKRRLMSD